MNTFAVSFFGHRDFAEHYFYEDKLIEIIKDLIRTKDYVDFIVGRNGEFDVFATSCVRKAKRELFNENSSLILLLPYSSAEYENDKDSFDRFYDEVYICEKSSAAHFKAAIQIRNREMVDQSDLIISYIKQKSGGAYKTIKYAEEKNKNIINIIDLDKWYVISHSKSYVVYGFKK